jgi:hypothetical protein
MNLTHCHQRLNGSIKKDMLVGILVIVSKKDKKPHLDINGK